MTVMPVLEVSKPYIPGRVSIEPRAEYNFRAGEHELLLATLERLWRLLEYEEVYYLQL